MNRTFVALVAIAVVAAVLIGLSAFVAYDSSTGVTLTAFTPYADSGAQVAYQMGILESGINVAQIAIAAGTINNTTAPVELSLYFMSNTTFNFEVDCVSFSISQAGARPDLVSVEPETQPASVNLHAIESSTAEARVVSFCQAQYVNKEGWAEYDAFLAPNGTGTFQVTVSLSMTKGANNFNESGSVTLAGLALSS